MNDEKLRAQLLAAKEVKAAQIAHCERNIDETKRLLESAEERLSAWIKMIPADVIGFMADEARRHAAEAEEAKHWDRLEASHQSALHQAHENFNGILPPEAQNKSIAFSLVGAGISCLLFIHVASSHLALKNEYALFGIAVLGAIAGVFAGYLFFDYNFVVDESLHRPSFDLRIPRRRRAD